MNCKKHDFTPSVQECYNCGAGLCKVCAERFTEREAFCAPCAVEVIKQNLFEKKAILLLSAAFLICGAFAYINYLFTGRGAISFRFVYGLVCLYGFTALPMGFYLLYDLKRKRSRAGGSLFILMPAWIWLAIILFFIYIWFLVGVVLGMMTLPFYGPKYFREVRNQKFFLNQVANDIDIQDAERQLIEQHNNRISLEEEALKGLAFRQ